MKGIQGLVVAITLGIAGFVLNWVYLNRKANQFENQGFIAIASNTTLAPGDVFREGHLVEVPIPKASAEKLAPVAIRWEDRETVYGMHAVHAYSGDELLFRKDLETPPPELELGEHERAMWIPVDQRTFVPALVVPGDEVDFLIRGPHPASRDPAGENASGAGARGMTDIIGPFRVLSLGNRLGKTDVMNAARMSQAQENVMTIRVKTVGNNLDEDAQRLLNALEASGFQEVGVLLRPRKSAGSK